MIHVAKTRVSQSMTFCEEVNTRQDISVKKHNEASDNSQRLDRKYGFFGDKCWTG